MRYNNSTWLSFICVALVGYTQYEVDRFRQWHDLKVIKLFHD